MHTRALPPSTTGGTGKTKHDVELRQQPPLTWELNVVGSRMPRLRADGGWPGCHSRRGGRHGGGAGRGGTTVMCRGTMSPRRCAREKECGRRISHVRATASAASLGSMPAGSTVGGYGEMMQRATMKGGGWGSLGWMMDTISTEGGLLVAYSSD